MSQVHTDDAPPAYAVRCEDSSGGCPECSNMKYGTIYRADMPQCSVCGYRNGLRAVRGGYVCYENHVWED